MTKLNQKNKVPSTLGNENNQNIYCSTNLFYKYSYFEITFFAFSFLPFKNIQTLSISVFLNKGSSFRLLKQCLELILQPPPSSPKIKNQWWKVTYAVKNQRIFVLVSEVKLRKPVFWVLKSWLKVFKYSLLYIKTTL